MFDQQPTTGFEELGLGVRLVSSIKALGFERPTPIQREAIPVLLEGRDLLGQAATGTGKTAAFALPILERLTRATVPGRPGALVLAPTRELALQVADAVQSYAESGARVLALYGGQPIHRQLRDLRDPVDVVVATPGRALDHLDRGTLSLDDVAVVVLDEADEMLDMGFADDLEAILSRAPAQRQTALFSATMPGRIAEVARRHLQDPVRIRVQRERVPEGEAPRVREVAWLVRREEKVEALSRLLAWEEPAAALLFCHTRADVDLVSQELESRGHRVEALHGGMSQERREQVLRRLRDGASQLLVATDVAARGLDVDVLTHVVNVDLPSSPEVYTHRVGRVGRAGREGVAISLVEPRQRRTLALIERVARRRLQREYVPDGDAIAARRRERLAERVRAAAGAEVSSALRSVFEELKGQLDLEALALAALALASGEAVTGGAAPRAEVADEAHDEVGPEAADPVDAADDACDEDPAPADEVEAPVAAAPVPPAPSEARRDAVVVERSEWRARDDRRDRADDRRPERSDERRFDRADRRARSDERRSDRRSDDAGFDRRGGERRPERPRDRRDGPSGRDRWDDRGRGHEQRGGPRAVRIWIGAGRNAGLRPGDLVGAITGEAGVQGRAVGAIRIGERSTTVEIEERHAESVLQALRRATLRGKKVKVRRDRTADS